MNFHPKNKHDSKENDDSEGRSSSNLYSMCMRMTLTTIIEEGDNVTTLFANKRGCESTV